MKSVGSYLRAGIAQVVYPVVYALQRFAQYQQENTQPALRETFLADVVRGAYSTLAKFGIQEPWKRRLLEAAQRSTIDDKVK